ncbi:MAG: adenylate/guanylate cyclase domain-containing protein [Myxococcota bacterium]
MAKLKIISQNPPVEYELKDYTTIGRMPRNTIQILDRILSKVHSQIIKLKDGRYLLKDLGSLNGTYINGQRITQHYLKDGDEFAMGSTLLRFEEQEPSEKEPDVYVSTDAVASEIHQTISADIAGDFLPESEIQDNAVLRQDYERLRISHEVATALGVEPELHTLLSKILNKIFEIFNCSRGIIFLPDAKGQMKPLVSQTKDGDEESGDIVVSSTILNNVAKKKEAVLSSDASMDSRFNTAKSIILQGIRSTMSVPMLYNEQLLGIIYLDSIMATGAFSKKDLHLLSGIATQAATAISNTNLIKKIENETKTRAQFEKLLSPNLVDQLIDGQLTFDQEGVQKEVTVIFADIRGFTSMSENMEAKDIVHMLNTYFEVMVDVIFNYQGTLDKFVGDEIMALFGTPVHLPEGPEKAVECALEMMASLEVYNTARQAEGKRPISIGIGINTGEVVCGALGSSKTLQYTVVGDPVNLASRLCSIAKPGQVLIGEETCNKNNVKNKFKLRALEKVSVKGKSKPVQVYEVLSLN